MCWCMLQCVLHCVKLRSTVCYSELQWVAASCSGLQCVAVRVAMCAAVYFSVLQCVLHWLAECLAVCCRISCSVLQSVLQYTSWVCVCMSTPIQVNTYNYIPLYKHIYTNLFTTTPIHPPSYPPMPSPTHTHHIAHIDISLGLQQHPCRPAVADLQCVELCCNACCSVL